MIDCYAQQQSFPSVIDTVCTVSLLPLGFVRNILDKIKRITHINILQAKDNLQINQMCKVLVKIDSIRKSAKFSLF